MLTDQGDVASSFAMDSVGNLPRKYRRRFATGFVVEENAGAFLVRNAAGSEAGKESDVANSVGSTFTCC